MGHVLPQQFTETGPHRMRFRWNDSVNAKIAHSVWILAQSAPGLSGKYLIVPKWTVTPCSARETVKSVRRPLARFVLYKRKYGHRLETHMAFRRNWALGLWFHFSVHTILWLL